MTPGGYSSVTVNAKDTYGNTVTGYRGMVHFTSSDSGATLPANYAFLAGDAGQHAFPVIFASAGMGRTLTVTDTANAMLTATQMVTVTQLPLAAPTLRSVTPDTGLPAGGTVVTLTGTGFQSGASVTFGSVAGTMLTFVDAQTLRVTTPMEAQGTVTVTVTNPDGQSAILHGYTFVAPGGVMPVSATRPISSPSGVAVPTVQPALHPTAASSSTAVPSAQPVRR